MSRRRNAYYPSTGRRAGPVRALHGEAVVSPKAGEERRAQRREPDGTLSAWVAAGSFALIAALSFAVDQALMLSPAGPEAIEPGPPGTGDGLSVQSPTPIVR